MKKAIKVTLLSLLSAMTLGGAAAGALSWFLAETNLPEVNIKANSAGAYFAYGTGTEDDPYGIATTRHLNNLAWLQYNGSFNEDYDEDGNPDHFYFELANDINVNGFCIPPIGTQEYPFIGVFNGNGHTITGVSVSNNESDYSDKPIKINYTTDPEIVGFFGVVGQLNTDESYDSTVNSIHDFTLASVDVKSTTSKTLIGLVAGYVNGDMSGVKVDGDSSLTVNGQDFLNSAYTRKLSDYGLVGYTTNKANAGSYSQEISQYYDSEDDKGGTGANFGGSVNMKDFYQRCGVLQGNSYSGGSSAKPFNVTHKYVGNDDEGFDYKGDIVNSTLPLYQYYDYDDETDTGGYIGTYYALVPNGSNRYYLTGGNYETDAYYIGYSYIKYITDGNNYLRFNGSLNNVTAQNNASPWNYIFGENQTISTTYNNRTYYLMNNNGTLVASNTATASTATKWNITLDDSDEEEVLTIVNGNYSLICLNNTWVLQDMNDLEVETTVMDYFTIKYTSGNTTRYATANGATLYTGNSTPSGNQTIFGATNTTDNATHFFTNGSGYVYTIYNNRTYYLCMYRRSGNNRYVCFSSSTTGNYYPFTMSNYEYDGTNGTFTFSTYVRATRSGTSYYLGYNTISTNTVNTITGVVVTTTESTTLNLDDYLLLHSSPETHDADRDSEGFVYDYKYTTYLPLNVYKGGETDLDGNAIGNYLEPCQDEKNGYNTGYITAGARANTGTTSANSDNRSLTVSSYAISKINNSYSTSSKKITKVRTITLNANNSLNDHEVNETDLAGFKRYTKTYSDVETLLSSDNSNIYGVHFVSGSYGNISKDCVVRAKNVKINENTYSDYDLPVYSIDFNLAHQGQITFWAGSYTGATTNSCNCFFSLHQVFRDPDDETTIVNTKEIKAVYANNSYSNYSVMYQYIDGTYSRPYKYVNNEQVSIIPNTEYVENYNLSGSSEEVANYLKTELNDGYGFTKVFDTEVITNRHTWTTANNASLYYFEIKMNKGEFCLGNINSATSSGTATADGAYLIYLDIGSNGNVSSNDRIEAYFVTTKNDAVPYPVGVDFLVYGADSVDVGGESFGVYINAENSGIVSFEIVNEHKVKMTLSNSEEISTTYSFHGSKYTTGDDPPDSMFVVTNDVPEDLVLPASGGVRTIYIKETYANEPDNPVYYTIVDTFTSLTEYTSDIADADLPLEIANVINTKIRTLELAGVFTRVSGTGTEIFDINPGFDNYDHETNTINITLSLNSTIRIQVSDIADNHSIFINNLNVANLDEQTYPPVSGS